MQARRLLWIILIVALTLRLYCALALPPSVPPGSDSGWYLGNAYTLITGKQPPGMVNEVSNLASPPLYFLLIGIPQAFLSTETSVILVRVVFSWVSPHPTNEIARLAYNLSEPVLRPVRRWLPPVSGFDLSPLVVTIVAFVLIAIVRDFA